MIKNPHIGDVVFVAHAYDTVFEPHIMTIDYIENHERYYGKLPVMNFAARRSEVKFYGFTKNQIFNNKEDCEKFIDLYYYSGLCEGCPYDNIAGTIIRCGTCSHCILSEKTSSKNTYICDLRGCLVHSSYSLAREACSSYEPKGGKGLTWGEYNNLLKNCDFNPECVFHKNSAHKTISYEKYIDETVTANHSFTANIDGESYDVVGVIMSRESWVNGDYIKDGGFICDGIEYLVTTTKRKIKATRREKMFFNAKRLIKAGV
jgi:hypothetical protein